MLGYRTLKGLGFFVGPEWTSSTYETHPTTLIYMWNTKQPHICPSWLILFQTQHAFVFHEVHCGLNINTDLWNKHYLLTRKVFSGILYAYSSDRTNVQKSEIFTKNDVYSYRRANRRASCSAAVLCRGCGAATCNTQHQSTKNFLGTLK